MKLGLMLLMLFMFASCGFEIVDTGYVGIKTNMGKIVGEPLPEGLHFYNPLTMDVLEMSVRNETFEFETSAYTKDLQQTKIKMAVIASLDRNNAHNMYREVGRSWDQAILLPMVVGSTKTVIGKWAADALVASRDEARSEVESILKSELGKKYVIISRVEMTDIEYTPAFEQAIEDKVKSVQRAQQKENEKREAIADAQKMIEQQRGEAESQILKAKAEAQQITMLANAQAEANRKLADSLTPTLIEYRKIEKWDGVQPQVTGSNAIIQLGTKTTTKTEAEEE